MMAYVPSEDLVAVAEAPPTIDQLIDVAWDKAAIYFPFSDVIVSEPCAVFDKRMSTAFYVGQSNIVGNITTDMIAVAGEDVQAELWIGAADHLPRLLRVVYPHEPAHALYQTEYSDWHIGDTVEPGVFASDRAAKGKPMPFAPPGAGQLPPTPAQSVEKSVRLGDRKMRAIWVAVTAALYATLPLAPAWAWMQAHAGGGYTHYGNAGGYEHSTSVSQEGVAHSSDAGGYEHGTAATSQGVAHASDAGGAWHGSAANSQGYAHASDYGGYYHSTAAGPSGVEHTNPYGTTTTSVNGAYYHQPAVVNNYGANCYNCGAPGWGGVAVGAAVGAAAGVAVGAAASAPAVTYPNYSSAAPAYVTPVAYAALPSGCLYRPAFQKYECGGAWLAPAYGANGVYLPSGFASISRRCNWSRTAVSLACWRRHDVEFNS